MTIKRDTLDMDNDRVELIRLFMSEAFGKQNLSDGLRKNTNPESYDKAVGLVEVMVPFEAFITALKPREGRIWKKREYFCSTYQDFFIAFKKSCDKWINALFAELKDEALVDMTPPPRTRPSIKIDDKNSLSDIIKVIYRVRSNLVHGNKTLNSRRNSLLIINSFHLMYDILYHILREEEIIR